MADLRDFTGKNRKFTGTTGIKISSGSQAQRVNEAGRFRFNTDVNLLEYYTGTEWKSIDAPPSITSFAIDGASAITSGTIDNELSGNASIAINGALFDASAAVVTFIGTSETLTPISTTINSANLITVTIAYSDFDVANSPYTIKVTNPSGLAAELSQALSADQTNPVFTNAADTTFVMFDSLRSSGITANQLCGASGATTFAVQVGSLPTGLTLNTSTGAISGTANAEGSDTTYTFTIRATGDDATVDRQFKITVKAPITTSITSTGPGTFSVPEGVTSLNVLMVAGGGSGGSSLGSGAGAGGMLEGTLTVEPGTNIAYVVGAGGNAGPSTDYSTGYYGQSTTFGPVPGTALTASAIGGGYGAGHAGGSPYSFGDGGTDKQATVSGTYNIGGTGGSGGGTGSSDGPTTAARGGYGNQSPSAGLTGYGNDGGTGGGGSPQSSHSGGGGGGAGGVGENTGADGFGQGGDGGIGRVSTITGSPVYYAGGGGGSYHGPQPGGAGSGGTGGGTAGSTSGRSSAGGTNTGGGSGCGWHPAGGSGAGGPGIIVVKI